MKSHEVAAAPIAVSPSQKKLKQARLPFKILSEPSPGNDTPSRKRKLSTPAEEVANKLGKICKENDTKEVLVIVSDDESKDGVRPQKDKDVSCLNPYVKLVDNAFKKKMQKTKGTKKERAKRSKGKPEEMKTDVSHQSTKEEDETMDVDIVPDSNSADNKDFEEENTLGPENEKSEKKTSKGDKNNSSKPETEAANTSVIISDDDEKEAAEIPNKKLRSQQIDSQKSEKKMSTPNNSKRKSTPRSRKTPKTNEDKKVVLKNTNNKTEAVDTSLKASDDEKKAEAKNMVTPKRKSKANKQETAKSDNNISTNETKGSVNSETIDEKSNNVQKEEVKPAETSVVISDSEPNLEEDNMVTPKRKLRAKIETPKSENIAKVNLNDSVASNEQTPKHNKSAADLSISRNSPLTPKQLQRQLEAAKRKEEKEKERLEREAKRQQEKEEREKARLEKEELKKKEREEKEEARKKEREEKEEARKKEKEEKEKQKELERKEKEEQKKKEKEEKDEQRKKEKEAKEEERRKKQEALDLEKQEQELKKKKAAEAFVNFFVPKQKTDKDQTVPAIKNNMLSSFTIKADMRLAPTVRIHLTEDKKKVLEDELHSQKLKDLYIKCLRSGLVKPESRGKTWPLEDNDVLIVEDELPLEGAGEVISCESAVREKLRPKLLSFHENRRPPYWGTWRKKSKYVKPRNPFGQEKILDYEIDSDEEWEDEQDGESIDGSGAGSDVDGGEDEYEVDNDVFVPHGYLSDEEGTMDGEEALALSPEAQKARLKNLEDEFETELKKPTEKLKPRLYGLIRANEDGGKPENCADALWNYFCKFAIIMDDNTENFKPPPEVETEKKKKKKKAPKTDETPKPEKKETPKVEKAPKEKTPKAEKPVVDIKKNQRRINTFWTKLKSP